MDQHGGTLVSYCPNLSENVESLRFYHIKKTQFRGKHHIHIYYKEKICLKKT